MQTSFRHKGILEQEAGPKKVNIVIRNETGSDSRTIRDITAGAFTLLLVAQKHGQIAGSIAFSPIDISNGTQNWHCLTKKAPPA